MATGGGLVAARHLINRGRDVQIVLTNPAEDMSTVPAHQLDILHRMAATVTMTLALPKIGLLGPEQVGRLYLADISVPRALYDRMGIDVGPVFADESIVLLDGMR